MPVVKTVQTVSHLVEGEALIERAPEFKVGDYIEKIWSGMNCTVRDVRFNRDHGQYEYLDGSICSDGWMLEKSIQRA